MSGTAVLLLVRPIVRHRDRFAQNDERSGWFERGAAVPARPVTVARCPGASSVCCASSLFRGAAREDLVGVRLECDRGLGGEEGMNLQASTL